MLKFFTLITFISCTVLISSCVDQLPLEGDLNYCPGLRLDDGTCPTPNQNTSRTSVTSGWNFKSSDNYNYDSNYIDISSQEASLKEIDTIFSTSDFNDGNILELTQQIIKLKYLINIIVVLT